MKELLNVHNLSFRFDQRKTDGISKLSFDLKEGEVFTIMGPSGSGKSTTLKCLSQEIKNYDGEINFYGDQNIQLVKSVDTLPHNQTILQYLLSDLSKVDPDEEKNINRIRTVLSQLELTNEINNEIISLSAGQKQRLILAQAFVHNPTILLLDEPFSSLDPNLKHHLYEDFFQLIEERSIGVILVTHDTKEAFSISDKIMILNYGEVQQMGTPQDIYFRPKNYFVANFIQETNLLPAKFIALDGDEMQIKLLNKEFSVTSNKNFQAKKEGDDILVIIHPEQIEIDESSSLKADILEKKFFGAYTQLTVKTLDHVFNLSISSYKLTSQKKIGIKLHPKLFYCLSEI